MFWESRWNSQIENFQKLKVLVPSQELFNGAPFSSLQKSSIGQNWLYKNPGIKFLAPK